MKRLALVSLALFGCHSDPSYYPSELITVTRAGVAAEVWASRIPRCPPQGSDAEGVVRRSGTLAAHTGTETLLLCDEDARCCNDFYPDAIYLDGADATSYRLTGSVGRFGYASNADCEWDVWSNLFRRVEVTVIGRLDGESIEVDQLCR